MSTKGLVYLWLYIIDIADTLHDMYDIDTSKDKEITKNLIELLVAELKKDSKFEPTRTIYHEIDEIVSELTKKKGGVTDKTKDIISRHIIRFSSTNINSGKGLYEILPDTKINKLFISQENSSDQFNKLSKLQEEHIYSDQVQQPNLQESKFQGEKVINSQTEQTNQQSLTRTIVTSLNRSKPIENSLVSDTSRWVDSNIREDTGGKPRIDINNKIVNRISPFVNSIINNRYHINHSPYDAIPDTILYDDNNYGVLYNEISIGYTFDSLTMHPNSLVTRVRGNYRLRGDTIVNEEKTNYYRIKMIGQNIDINSNDGTLKCSFTISLRGIDFHSEIYCIHKENSKNNMMEILEILHSDRIKEIIIQEIFNPNKYKLDTINTDIHICYTHIEILKEYTKKKPLRVLSILIYISDINYKLWKLQSTLLQNELYNMYKGQIKFCLASFKRVGDRIPLLTSIEMNAIIDTEDFMVRVYYFWLVQYLRLHEYSKSLQPTIFRNNQEQGDIILRRKYLKYKNKYLELKKKVLNQ
jgi:hypothetical protein